MNSSFRGRVAIVTGAAKGIVALQVQEIQP